MKKLVFATMAIFAMFALVGCGGGDSDDPAPTPTTPGVTPTVTSVTVTGGSTTIHQGETSAAFTAAVTGENSPAQTVTWSLVGETDDTAIQNTVATFDSTERKVTVTQTAEVGTKFRVKATSTVDTSKFGYSNVITVAKHRTLEGIRIETTPNANITTIRQYLGTLPSDANGWTGLSVFAEYDDGSDEELVNDDGEPLFTVDASAVDINTKGTYEVKVKYLTFEKPFNVTVDELTDIVLRQASGVKSDYYQFYDTVLHSDIDNIQVWAEFETLDETQLSLDGTNGYSVNKTVDLTTAGAKNVVFTFKTKPVNFPITVIALDSIDIDISSFASNDVPTKANVLLTPVITAKYGTGTNAHEIDITSLINENNVTIGTASPVAAGDEYEITITWHGQHDTFTYLRTDAEVMNPALLVTGSYKTTYYRFIDTEFDQTNLVAAAEFSKTTPNKTVTPFVRYDYNEEIFTQPGVHTNAITVSYTDGDNGEPRVSPIDTDAVYHITITVIDALSLSIELNKNEFKTIDNDIAKAAIKTANVIYADSTSKSILSSLTAYDPEHDTGNVNVDTGRKEIIVSWHGLDKEIAYFLTGDLDLIISVKDFYDVSIKTIELGAIHILTETPPTVELSGDSEYTSIKWILNGTDTGKTAREYQIVLGASAKIGRNVLSVEVVLDGVTYRKNIVYTVIL